MVIVLFASRRESESESGSKWGGWGEECSQAKQGQRMFVVR
jgi:hypothetical protein